MGNIMQAFNQWASRPADQRFWNLEECFKACKKYADDSREAVIPWERFRFEAESDESVIIKTSDGPGKARPTHYSFGQLAQRVNAPAAYLRRLPAPLAARCLQQGMEDRIKAGIGNGDAVVLFQEQGPGEYLIRCAVTERYSRVWNYEVVARLGELQERDRNWKTPPARPAPVPGQDTRIATEADCLSGKGGPLSIRPGDIIGAAGIYASDHDIFIFLVNEHLEILQGPGGAPVNIGIIICNSEVGDKSLRARLFLFDHVCGNHIIWGGRDLANFRRRHTGEIAARFNSDLFRTLQAAPAAARMLGPKVTQAQQFEFAKNREEVLIEVGRAAKKVGALLPDKTIASGYDRAERDGLYGSPRSLWGIVAGITADSQRPEGFADQRNAVDTEAGKLFRILN